MKNYNVYHHVKLNKYEVVKNGYNFPAFFFGLLWMLYSRLWMYSALFILLILLTSFIEEATYYMYYMDITLLTSLLFVGIGVWIGFKGNEWKRDRLVKHGYDLVGENINAHNTDDAISKIGS